MAVFNFSPLEGRPVAFPRVSAQPTLHFFSARRQTRLESKMKRSDRGRPGQRKGDERKRGRHRVS